MQPWKISVGLTAIICAGGLMLAGQGFSWLRTLLLDGPHRFLASPSHGTEGWPWPR